MNTKFKKLEIELDRNCSNQPEIRVLQSTFDRPREPFNFPEEDRKKIDAKVQEFSQILLTKDNEDRRRQLAEEIGVDLYRILLPNKIGRTCERSFDALAPDEGLQLRLSFGRDYDHQLGSLPWELACKPETRRYIGKNQRFSVARYLDIGEQIPPLEVKPPLKVLVVLASPDPATSEEFGYSSICKEYHHRVLEEAIGQAKNLQVRFLDQLVDDGRATLGALRNELRDARLADSPYHAVHILCHGSFRKNEGILFFERSDGSEQVVTGRELADSLTPEVRLVVLASCSTAKIPIPRVAGRHPFAGVASALVACGKPAVLAMQFTVSEAAVAAFSKVFYHMIDMSEPIDVAVTEGRLAIQADGLSGALEWATPVLFLRAFDGKILNLAPGKTPRKKVAIFNVLDHGKDKMKQTDFRVDLRPCFERRFIKCREYWNDTVLGDLQRTLRVQLPPQNPVHIELAAPLSVAFAVGFLLPAKERRTISVGQQDKIWELDEPLVPVPSWLDEKRLNAFLPKDFPLAEDSSDIAVIVESPKSAIEDVSDYLSRRGGTSPSVGGLVHARFEEHDHFVVLGGGHARSLAMTLVKRIKDMARGRRNPTIHFFLAGPHGLALAIGREAHVLNRIQLYEFDLEKKRHGSYEPSITLVPSMGGNG